jgi:hypothetical protein
MARLFSARTFILGGLAAGAAYALRNNPTVKGLLGGGGPAPAPYNPPGPAPAPPVANADVAGPPQNTATHVPAPEPLVHAPEGGIDEEAEVAAAAAEAANIGGTPAEYPSEDDPSAPIDEALRPLEEAGEGYAEGQELAEADLIDNAEPSAGDPIEGERAIEAAIDAQDDPAAGESGEAIEQLGLAEEPPPAGEPADVPPPEELTAEQKSANVWRRDDQPTEEQPKVEDDKE